MPYTGPMFAQVGNIIYCLYKIVETSEDITFRFESTLGIIFFCTLFIACTAGAVKVIFVAYRANKVKHITKYRRSLE